MKPNFLKRQGITGIRRFDIPYFERFGSVLVQLEQLIARRSTYYISTHSYNDANYNHEESYPWLFFKCTIHASSV